MIVAGDDFGCGSSREHAVWAIRGARSCRQLSQRHLPGYFYRNASTADFIRSRCKDAVERINDGDEIEIDYEKGIIEDKTSGQKIKFKPLPDFALEIIRDGGLFEHIKKVKIKKISQIARKISIDKEKKTWRRVLRVTR